MPHILIVDDEKRMGQLLGEELAEAGFRVQVETTGAGALQRLQSDHFDLVISDIRMTPPDGMEILRAVKEHSPQTDVVMMTAYSSVQSAREAFKLGATDYVLKPFDIEEVRRIVESILEKRRLAQENVSLAQENRLLRDQLAGRERVSIVGESAAVQELHRLIGLVASTEATVLIQGASGSGKELVAREIHVRSSRAARPFVAVNCAAIPDSLLESELFGHEKGAFTGAEARRQGRFELAQSGTIFLDEIGEMGAEVQAKLLRVLEERKVTRLGGAQSFDVDIRILAATNRDLASAIARGSFREDLFYRLNVFPIQVPSLAARRDDVPLLAEFFLRELRYPHAQLPANMAEQLRAQDWPGNVRELRNVVERATILAQGQPLTATHFPQSGISGQAPSLSGPTIGVAGQGPQWTAGADQPMDLPAGGVDLDRLEAHLIRRALERTNNNKTEAAKLLGMTRRTLYSRMEKHGIPI